MKDKLGNWLNIDDTVCWSASGYFGGLRFGTVAALEGKATHPGPYLEPGVVVVNKHRRSPRDKKTVRLHFSQVVLVVNQPQQEAA